MIIIKENCVKNKIHMIINKNFKVTFKSLVTEKNPTEKSTPMLIIIKNDVRLTISVQLSRHLSETTITNFVKMPA